MRLDPQVLLFFFLSSTNDYLQIDYAYRMGTGTTTTPGAHEVQQQQRNSPLPPGQDQGGNATRVCFFFLALLTIETGPRRHENSSQAVPQRPEREIKD